MNTTYILSVALTIAMIILTGCDTTEEGFHPGNSSEIRLGVENTSLEFASSKGSSAILKITGNSKWIIDCDDSRFGFSKKSGIGADEVTITATSRNPDKVFTVSFNVISESTEGLNFNQEVKLTQEAALISDKLITSFTNYPEEGGEQEIEVKSTVDWVFNVEGSEESKAGFDVDPQSGKGQVRSFKVKMSYGPNYSQEERSVSVTFDPSNNTDLATLQDKLAPAIKLTQESGTLPTNLMSNLGNPTFTECPLSLKFDSKAPIEECGVIIDGTLKIIAPLASSDAREVAWRLTGLSEGNQYSVVPFVKSKVGLSEGNEIILSMDKIPKITNLDFEIESYRITALISIASGVRVTNVGIEIFNDLNMDSPLATYSNASVPMEKFMESISTEEIFAPNSDYDVRPFIVYVDSESQSYTYYHNRVKIHTKGQAPSLDDNTPI